MHPFFLSVLLSMTPTLPSGGVVVAKGECFRAEAALTQKEQTNGLMRRESLAKDHCMIFIYREDGDHRIWMKNCLISLDVVWVQGDGTIAEFAENVPPLSPMYNDEEAPTYGGKVPSRHFIEFPSGTIKRLGLKVGDRIGWSLKQENGQPILGGAPVGKNCKP